MSTSIQLFTYVSGFTYSDNNFTIYQNQSRPPLVANISTMTGLTINGDFYLNGDTNQIGNFNITGNTSHIGDFNVTGNTNQDGNFYITGLIEQIGDVYQVGNVFLTGYTEQIGDVYLTGNTEQIGDIFLTGNTDQIGNVNITGNTIIDGSLSADTITITNIPTLNNTLFQILGRNETTGDVEYRQVNTIGNNVTILTGGTYSAQTTIDNVIGVDTTLTTTTIYLPDSVTSGRLRFEIKDIGLNAYNNPITIIATGLDTIISYTNSQTLILESEGGAIILFNSGLGQWWQM